MAKSEHEIWKPVIGYEGFYEVSNLGRIKSIERTRKTKGGGLVKVCERILKQSENKFGYSKIGLSKNGKHRWFATHRLVAMAFLPNEDNKPEINHKDGNKKNNCISNLEWCTPTENKRHAFSMGLNGGEHLTHRKSVKQYDKDNHLLAIFPSITDATLKTGIRHSSIWMCCNNRYKTAGGYIWRYAIEKEYYNEIRRS